MNFKLTRPVSLRGDTLKQKPSGQASERHTRIQGGDTVADPWTIDLLRLIRGQVICKRIDLRKLESQENRTIVQLSYDFRYLGYF